MMDIGTKKGLTREGPRLWSTPWLFSMVWRPPIPQPITTPTRVLSTWGESSRPDCATAWTAAPTAYCRKRSRRLASLRSTYWSTWKSFTCPAILTAKAVVSK